MTGSTLRLDEAAQTWDLLARHVERFIQSWDELGRPPELASFLPTEPPALRRLVLVELIKVDLEYRWRAGQTRKSVEQYAVEHAELAGAAGVPPDLIYEEFHVRRQSGDAVETEEYFRRFPGQADQLARLLRLEGPEATSALVPARPVAQLEPGESIDDFDLLTRLGRGAFATVFLARQRSMQRLVALKVSADRGDEPQTLAQLDHPNIVRVYDQRRMEDTKLRLLYMQYVAGGTLLEVVERVRAAPADERTGKLLVDAVDAALGRAGSEPPPATSARRKLAASPWPEVVCRIGAQLVQALDYAHSRGVLHRDVKPANVLLAADTFPKLVDFNVSFRRQVAGSTPAAYFGGSLAYMSPEQLEACNAHHERGPETLDERSDLYSLAVMLWELLYGQRPFRDDDVSPDWNATLARMTERRRGGPPSDPPVALRGGCAAQLHAVLVRCLAANAGDRYATGQDLARDLALCLQPRTHEILRSAAGDWRGWARRFPIVAVLFAVLVPNALAGVFNYHYNRHETMAPLAANATAARSGALEAFHRVQLAINGVAFPLGTIVGIALMWPVAAALRKSRSGAPDDGELASARSRVLRMGQYAAILSIVEWLVAGLAYPVSLHVLVGSLPAAAYAQFAVSLALCGLIAAAYPYLLVTALAVRAIYPALLPKGVVDERDEPDLVTIARRCPLYLWIAGGVPMLGVALLAMSGAQSRVAVGALSVAGAVGFGAAMWICRALQRDVAALLSALAPMDAFGTGTDRVDAL